MEPRESKLSANEVDAEARGDACERAGSGACSSVRDWGIFCADRSMFQQARTKALTSEQISSFDLSLVSTL